MSKKYLTILAILVVAVVAFLLLAACGGAGRPAPAPLSINLKAEDIKYDATTMTANVGQPVTINIQNTGALEHSFVIDQFNVKLEHIQAGQSATITFTPTAAGTYAFYCDVAGHKDAGMKGSLTVNP
jgi:uncharacterized cupredoxin-like copper-binding protein